MKTVTRYSVLFQGKVMLSGFTSRKLAHEWAEREINGVCVILTDRQAAEMPVRSDGEGLPMENAQ